MGLPLTRQQKGGMRSTKESILEAVCVFSCSILIINALYRNINKTARPARVSACPSRVLTAIAVRLHAIRKEKKARVLHAWYPERTRTRLGK
jgi:hypothetical protein